MTPTSACKPRQTAVARPPAGFTLLELLLVLTIIGMASVLIVPNVGNLEARTFSAQVRQANALLNYARRMAVVQGQPTSAVFLARLEDESDRREPAPLNSIGTWESYGSAIRFRDSTEHEVEVEEKIEIIFYPEGGSTGGTLPLSQDDQQVMIEVDPFTGRVATRYDEEE